MTSSIAFPEKCDITVNIGRRNVTFRRISLYFACLHVLTMELRFSDKRKWSTVLPLLPFYLLSPSLFWYHLILVFFSLLHLPLFLLPLPFFSFSILFYRFFHRLLFLSPPLFESELGETAPAAPQNATAASPAARHRILFWRLSCPD